MKREYKMPKKYQHGRKYHGKCERCGKKTLAGDVFQQIDESNIAITYNAPYLCQPCFKERYP